MFTFPFFFSSSLFFLPSNSILLRDFLWLQIFSLFLLITLIQYYNYISFVFSYTNITILYVTIQRCYVLYLFNFLITLIFYFNDPVYIASLHPFCLRQSTRSRRFETILFATISPVMSFWCHPIVRDYFLGRIASASFSCLD